MLQINHLDQGEHKTAMEILKLLEDYPDFGRLNIINSFDESDRQRVVQLLSKLADIRYIASHRAKTGIDSVKTVYHLTEKGMRVLELEERISGRPLAIDVGRAYFAETPIANVKIPVEDLAMHMVVLGESGFGKTTFTINLLAQLFDLCPELNWTILDFKGEYLGYLYPVIDGILVLKPGLNDIYESGGATFAPLHIDLLESSRDENRERLVERAFSLLKESLSSLFRDNAELSPLMERIFYDCLSQVYGNRGDACVSRRAGFFSLLFHEIDTYVRAFGKVRRDVQRSAEALRNRLDRFKRGVLGDVLNPSGKGENGHVVSSSSSLFAGKTIVDLSECAERGSTSEELRLLVNMIMSVILEEAFRRGLTHTPTTRHITIVEEANLLVPEVFRRVTTSDLTATEDMVLAARGFGEALILIAQRPTISSFVLANTGTKVVFRTPYDAKKVGGFLGLNEEQEESLKTLRRYEAIIRTVRGGPYRVPTASPQQHPSVPPRPPQERQRPESTLVASKESPPSASTEIKTLADQVGEEPTENNDQIGGTGTGSVVVDWWDVHRLLGKVGSDMFRLFRVIGVANQSITKIKVGQLADMVFRGERWRFQDALKVLTDTKIWMMPLIQTGNGAVTLTAYGENIWQTIQQERRERISEEKRGGARIGSRLPNLKQQGSEDISTRVYE